MLRKPFHLGPTRRARSLLAAVVLLSSTVSAEPTLVEPSLRSWVSLEPLSEALDRPGAERQRAIERLSGIGSGASVAVLVRWLEEQPALTLEDWRRVVRALVPHARQPSARRWLGKLLSGAPLVDAEGEEALRTMIRASAAVGLARAGDERALSHLGRALRQTPEQGQLARQALLAHPPRVLEPLLEAPGAPSVEYVQTLEELGDQRAFHPLRGLVRRGTPEIQGRATLALFRMGHLETVEVAAHWLKSAPQHPAWLPAATEIVLAVDHELAAEALRQLLASSSEMALELSSRYPSRALVPVLEQALNELSPELQRRTLEVFGAVGGARALALLEEQLSSTGLTGAAAFALGKSADPDATAVLLGVLASERVGLVATRALVMRGWIRRERWAELDTHLEQLSRSREPTARWVGLWGQAVASEAFARSLLDGSPLEVSASTATVLVHSPALARDALQRLARDLGRDAGQGRRTGGLTAAQSALIPGLSRPEAHVELSSPTVHRLLGARPSLAIALTPLLTSRADEPRPSIGRALLESPDRSVRASALRALSAQTNRSTLGTLRRAYEAELDARVRRAILQGISVHPPSIAKTRLLERAAAFDPDPSARRLARLAMHASARPSAIGSQAVWLELPPTDADPLIQLVADNAMVFPVVRPPDGLVVVLGFPDSPFTIRWSPQAR